MRLGNYKDITFLGFAKFDGWDVIAPVAIVLIILPYLVKRAPTFLIPIGASLLALWLIGVIVASVRKKNNGPREGGGGASRKKVSK